MATCSIVKAPDAPELVVPELVVPVLVVPELEVGAGEVGAEPGSISTTSASAHIYEHDWDWIEEKLLGRGEA